MRRILRWIWLGLRGLALVIGFSVLTVLIAVGVGVGLSGGTTDVAPQSTLYLAFDGQLAETPSSRHLRDAFNDVEPSVLRVIKTIDRAAEDQRITALLVNLSFWEMSAAQADAFAEAVRGFRESGKKAYVFSSYYDLTGYRFAAAFDEIWAPESGNFLVGGMALQTLHARRFLNDIGVRAEFEQRKAYKGAADMLTTDRLSEPMRRAYQGLMDDAYGGILAAIRTDRGLPNGDSDLAQQFRDAFWDVAEAREIGLIDGMGHLEDLQRRLPGAVIGFRGYWPVAAEPVEDARARVAYVAAVGEIHEGRASPVAQSIGARSLIEALWEAEQDDTIDAILLRIDSPGGGYHASDSIAHAMRRIEKPIIVSMGSVAASGGYMIAMAADKVLAHPETLTGSIGVIGGKITVADLLADNDINVETVESGSMGAIFSPLARFTAVERRVLGASMDRIYDAFVAMTAKRRKLSPEDAEAAAQGRVWTGRQAVDLGLVDRLGGYRSALNDVRGSLGLGLDRKLDVVEYPELSASQRLFHRAEDGLIRADTWLGRLLSPEQALTDLNSRAGIKALMPAMEMR